MALPSEPQTGLFPEIESRDFIRSESLERVAGEILARHGNRGHVGVASLADVAQAIDDGQLRILYLSNVKPFDPLKEEVAHDAIAKAIKAPALWRDVTGFDAVIWARSYFWGLFTPDQCNGVALHELLHLDVEFDDEGKAKLRLRKHDVEEFISVLRFYGPLDEARTALVRAFGQWEADGGRPAPKEPSSITVRASGGREVRFDAAMADRLSERIGTKGKSKPKAPRLVEAIVADIARMDPRDAAVVVDTVEALHRENSRQALDDEDLRPTGEVNPDALRGEADRATVMSEATERVAEKRAARAAAAGPGFTPAQAAQAAAELERDLDGPGH